MTRHLAIISLAVVVAAGIALLIPRSAPSNLPKMLLGQSAEIDMGVIAVGGSKPMRIALCNSGSASLKVTDVQTSCGCVRVTDCPASILPGEAAVVTVIVEPRAVGIQKSKVLILTDHNDPARYAFEASVTSCGAGVRVAPVSLDFGDIHSGSEVTQSLSVSSFGAELCEIVTVSGPSWLTIAPHPEGFVQANTSYERRQSLALSARDLPLGRVRDSVHLEGLRNGQRFQLDVPVTANGAPKWHCTPTQLVLIVAADAIKSPSQTLSIGGEDLPGDIVISVDDPRLQWSIRSTEPALVLDVWIDIANSGRRNPLSTLLRGKTRGGDEIFNTRVIGIFKS